MQLARVIGTVVATRKEEALVGFKLLVLEIINPGIEDGPKQRIVATDTLGAGVGDEVLYVTGSGARAIYDSATPIDACIVGIVDSTDIEI